VSEVSTAQLATTLAAVTARLSRLIVIREVRDDEKTKKVTIVSLEEA
jgi:hypothetical protein